jgi:ankyrin repeat protein
MLGGREALIRLLLDAGARFNVMDVDHRTPFMLAIAFGQVDTVLLLLELRAAEFPPAKVPFLPLSS